MVVDVVVDVVVVVGSPDVVDVVVDVVVVEVEVVSGPTVVVVDVSTAVAASVDEEV